MGDPGGQKAAQEPAVGPGSKAGQQCPGLYEQKCGQEIEGSHFSCYSSLFAQARYTVSFSGPHIRRKTSMNRKKSGGGPTG